MQASLGQELLFFVGSEVGRQVRWRAATRAATRHPHHEASLLLSQLGKRYAIDALVAE